MKILLADDDPDTLELARAALGEYGYRVIGARDGLQALRRWELEQPDLVLVDAQLPGTNRIADLASRDLGAGRDPARACSWPIR